MNKSIKIGILLATIVLPIFVFLFLKFFGQNHFSLRYYVPVDVIENTETGVPDTIFHTVPDFSLTNQYGETVTMQTVSGKIKVVDFFFTTCPGICPKMSTQLSRVQKTFADVSELVILSHTVNPEEDSVEVMSAYANQYGAVKGKWHLLTGNKSSIYQLGEKGYFLPVSEGDTGIADDFIHSEKFILVDKENHIRGFYDGTDQKEVDRLITEINVLKHEYDNK